MSDKAIIRARQLGRAEWDRGHGRPSKEHDEDVAAAIREAAAEAQEEITTLREKLAAADRRVESCRTATATAEAARMDAQQELRETKDLLAREVAGWRQLLDNAEARAEAAEAQLAAAREAASIYSKASDAATARAEAAEKRAEEAEAALAVLRKEVRR